ncbi:MAG: hypothetical protein K6T31_01570 [Alicyclobacillus sp.]|nr:hypothetical protein [Alicyclobacillus sp.]
MFRLLGKLWRAWEIYSFLRTFSPLSFAFNKLWEQVWSRLRFVDTLFLLSAGALAVIWVLELCNWPIQGVLALRRWSGSTEYWPTWPSLAWLAHPTWRAWWSWLSCGALLLAAVIRWTLAFVRRLWPMELWERLRGSFQMAGSQPGDKPGQSLPGWDTPVRIPPVPPLRWPPGLLCLAAAWLLQGLLWVR